jgi:hypothetical protein
LDPSRLTFQITKADGSKVRWAQDELDPQDRPSAFSFGTVKPGGFGQFSVTLPRGLDPGPDENLLDTFTAYGPGGRVVYEGRVHRLPRSQGDSKTVTVQGVGWASHLSDNRAVSALIVDRNLSAWGDMSAARQGTLAGTFDISSGTISQVFDATHGPGFSALAPAPMNNVLMERWYDAGPGQLVAKILVDYQALVGISAGDASTIVDVATSDDDQGSSMSVSSNQLANAAISFTAGTARRYALLHFAYTGSAGGTAPSSLGVQWQGVSTHGNHGLALTGTGYTASDILKYMLPLYAPKLTFSDSTIPDTTFGISQAVYAQTSMDQVLLDVNKYELRPWYVWDNRTFYYPDKDEAPVVWQARLADGAKVAADGDDVVQMASSAYVYFTDEYGRSRVYAPTGGNGDYTSDDLLGDGTDPYSLHGIDAPQTFTINTPIPAADALQIGRLWLAENNAPKRSGQIVLQGYVQHPTEGKVPSWRVRAGDSIIVTDRVGDTARPIVATSYDHQSRTNTVTLEAGPLFRLDGLVQRLAVMVGAVNQ